MKNKPIYAKILLPIDDTPGAAFGARVGFHLAHQLATRTLLMTVRGGWPGAASPEATRAWEGYKAEGQALLERLASEGRSLGAEVETLLEEDDLIVEAIARVAEREGCDLIALCSHGREGLPRALLGSVAEGVLRQATVPVLLVRFASDRDTLTQFNHILIPTDGSPVADLALDHARCLGEQLGARVTILHVLQLPQTFPVGILRGSLIEQDELRSAGEAILSAAQGRLGGLSSQTLLREAHHERVSDVITRVAKEERVNLIVMGTHGRSGMDRLLLGSVAERVAHRCEVPALLVRGVEPA